MSLTRNDVKKALADYDKETKAKYGSVRWIPIIGKVFSDPIKIQELREFVAQTENSIINDEQPFKEAKYLELVLKLLDISYNATLTGLSDDLYRCFNSDDLLISAMGAYGKEKTATLNMLYVDQLASKENILRVSQLSMFSNAIPKELKNRRREHINLEQEDVNNILEKYSSPRL